MRIVFRDYPLPNHPQAQPAAEAAQCANDQGKFWEYHDKLFQNQRAMEPDNLKQYATDLGLNLEAFNECVDSRKYRADVQRDLQEGKKIGVTGTPAFFINGRFLSGAQPFENFKAVIDQELGN